jgi:hypothetical protein
MRRDGWKYWETRLRRSPGLADIDHRAEAVLVQVHARAGAAPGTACSGCGRVIGMDRPWILWVGGRSAKAGEGLHGSGISDS